jgi:hypothetical protein
MKQSNLIKQLKKTLREAGVSTKGIKDGMSIDVLDKLAYSGELSKVKSPVVVASLPTWRDAKKRSKNDKTS